MSRGSNKSKFRCGELRTLRRVFHSVSGKKLEIGCVMQIIKLKQRKEKGQVRFLYMLEERKPRSKQAASVLILSHRQVKRETRPFSPD